MLSFLIAQTVTQSVIQSIETVSQNATQPINAAHNFSQSLRVMGLGMLGIFCIIGIIILMTWILQKLFPVKAE